MQGVDINDKHIEVIVRQMMRKLKVMSRATDLLPGATIEKSDFNKENKRVSASARQREGFTPATCEPVLLGITKASLATDSASCRRHPSRKPQEFSPMQLSRAKLILLSALKKMLLSVSFFRQARV